MYVVYNNVQSKEVIDVYQQPMTDVYTLQKCKGHFNPRWVTSVASVQRFLQCACKGHFNPSWVLSVIVVSIMAQLANLK